MTNPEAKNRDIYGHDPLPWSRALAALEATGDRQEFWLATTRPDERPHVTGFGGLWSDGKIYLVSGESTRKSKNLAANPNCSVGVSLRGLDLVIEGTARRVTDPATLTRIAGRYNAVGWPVTVDGDVFTAPYSAPSAGPAPWNLYEIAPATVFGVAMEKPDGATRWRFQ